MHILPAQNSSTYLGLAPHPSPWQELAAEQLSDVPSTLPLLLWLPLLLLS
jgi:hypothetical protein